MSVPVVELSLYQSNWEKLYIEEKGKIESALEQKVTAIEHFGSTSIKGMEAKPIIDILVAMKDLNDAVTMIAPLSKLGYKYVAKPEQRERYFFNKNSRFHLHICEIDSKEWTEKILFRDFLRAYPDVASAYITMKKGLAAQYKFDRPTYTKHKEPFIREVIKIAEVCWR
ncbi:GrpB family protein [Cytobacillus purgationiresistens]|uniref:GrpB-like predicted nucleotidyltransferase (UPF0157 family) n=1 Tax=Cytobacillus purgationiresistens TaxID=863449 RepID=A0ABU0AJ33_9BACI|nr:GrpB family protein [Cytobacillus purgationiresistens]MDQ0271276.1 GrpB-like predicted nucleotidyltransferase (UPF0157 family) [Cytobacillus purgationiresistens]